MWSCSIPSEPAAGPAGGKVAVTMDLDTANEGPEHLAAQDPAGVGRMVGTVEQLFGNDRPRGVLV